MSTSDATNQPAEQPTEPATFQQLRSAHRSALEQLKEAQRERDELRALAADTTGLSRRLLEQTVLNQARGLMVDPRDALALADLSPHQRPDGTVDEQGVRAAVEKLVEEHPYLRAQPAGPGGIPLGPVRPLPGPGVRPSRPVGSRPTQGNEEMNRAIRRAAWGLGDGDDD